jgi:hypothetical protein
VVRELAEAIADTPFDARETAIDATRGALRRELSRLPPELEAKVCLLVTNHYSSELGTDLGEALMKGCDGLRLSTDRLFELLNHKDGWTDVELDRDRYNAMVTQIGRSAKALFRPQHVPQLKLVIAREAPNLWWQANAALRIGVSQLLPAATTDVDAIDTRDGFLRQVVRDHAEVPVRGAAAQELIRVNLRVNWDFLEQQFFSQATTGGSSDLRLFVLEELGRQPFTRDKRTALVSVVLDSRFDPLWTRPSHVMGDDLYRQYAILAINSHAGRELLTIYDKQELGDPATAGATLVAIRKKVAAALQ